MRIEHRGEDALTLWMESGESILLRSWLEEYPMMSGEDRTLSERSAIPRKEEFDQQLRSCLQEHAQSNQDRLRRWMEEDWTSRPDCALLRIGDQDRDWLLQVLNDLHLGNWKKLGSPDAPDMERILDRVKPLSKEHLHLMGFYLTMRMQAMILDA